MIPTPLSIGLTLCSSGIIEEGTRNLTLVGSFVNFRSADFLFSPAPFQVVASLVAATGKGNWN